ncbi:hypothetical protein P154DRAFT_138622 [Amniculicola lignicola CBS 123094]|uniref:Uncharacterized protein n=1 Tax=Amniculicola lignicola CBS 123094 TaxID=1392246 RepID=A0A6A5WND6_9PLEO|nr:hypothetical protein P154DRAFT_138622 [Amniculicola lignicola CBS 123094]
MIAARAEGRVGNRSFGANTYTAVVGRLWTGWAWEGPRGKVAGGRAAAACWADGVAVCEQRRRETGRAEPRRALGAVVVVVVRAGSAGGASWWREAAEVRCQRRVPNLWRPTAGPRGFKIRKRAEQPRRQAIAAANQRPGWHGVSACPPAGGHELPGDVRQLAIACVWPPVWPFPRLTVNNSNIGH